MKNKLTDLNNHLFEQLERLNDEALKGEDLEKEIERSRAISSISKDIISNAGLQLQAVKLSVEYPALKRDGLTPLLGYQS